jgi:hypothetical protein
LSFPFWYLFCCIYFKIEAPRPSRYDGTGTAGPFDRVLGTEHVEGLPGKVISFYIVLPRPISCGRIPDRSDGNGGKTPGG